MSSLQRLQRLTASLPFVTVSHCEPITGDSIWHSVAPALGMRRPFDLLLYPLILLFFDPGTQFPGNEKLTLCNTKSTKIKLA